MKKRKFLDAMGQIDDKYIEEAAPKVKEKRKINPIKAIALAASLSIVIGSLGLWLFLPFDRGAPSVLKYSGSEYYEIIEKLNEITYLPKKAELYRNNFDKVWSNLRGAIQNVDMESSDGLKGDAPNGGVNDGLSGVFPNGDEWYATGTDFGENYEEVTDNQVEGVTEADIIKRSNKYIYYLDGEILKVYSIDGENSVKLGEKNIYTQKQDDRFFYTSPREMYLSEDCKTVTVILGISREEGEGNLKASTCLISFDVSDLENIVEKKTVTVGGSYFSSRMLSGDILLVNNFYVKNNPDFSDESQFVPQIDTGDGKKSISPENIICPDKLSHARYTVVCRIDANTLSLEDSAALLSYTSEIYVSKNSLYVTRTYTGKEEYSDHVNIMNMTDIAVLDHSDGGFEHKGTVTLCGHVKDQYSLDEYEGILRVVTTTGSQNISNKSIELYGYSADSLAVDTNSSNASLYCIDLETLKTVASVEGFAPDGETVESVRFDREYAYVCTAKKVVFKDPVYFFDLSDLKNITYKETGEIEGYSSSLVNFGDGFLLGIGYGDSRTTLKIEVWEESEDGVVSVCDYVSENSYWSEDYKAYLIDRERGFVGLGITNHTSDVPFAYALLHFDGYQLHELIYTSLDGNNDFKRGVYIDGYLYLFGQNDFKVESVN